jgi:hypothetical protein
MKTIGGPNKLEQSMAGWAPAKIENVPEKRRSYIMWRVISEFYGKLLIWIERTAAVHRPSQEAIILHFLLLEVCSE